jgi:hypothetical protein
MHTLTYKHTHHAHRADLALRIYCGVEVSELITNKHQYPLIEREEKTWGGRGRGGGGARRTFGVHAQQHNAGERVCRIA